MFTTTKHFWIGLFFTDKDRHTSVQSTNENKYEMYRCARDLGIFFSSVCFILLFLLAFILKCFCIVLMLCSINWCWLMRMPCLIITSRVFIPIYLLLFTLRSLSEQIPLFSQHIIRFVTSQCYILALKWLIIFFFFFPSQRILRIATITN